MDKGARRAMSVLAIGTVMQLTNLTARQIRYYEEHELIIPKRTKGNRRMFSLNDIDDLLEIQEMLEQGINIAGIKKIFALKKEAKKRTFRGVDLDELDFRSIVQKEMQHL